MLNTYMIGNLPILSVPNTLKISGNFLFIFKGINILVSQWDLFQLLRKVQFSVNIVYSHTLVFCHTGFYAAEILMFWQQKMLMKHFVWAVLWNKGYLPFVIADFCAFFFFFFIMAVFSGNHAD